MSRKQTLRGLLVALLVLLGFGGARWVFLRTIYEAPVAEAPAPRAVVPATPAPLPAPVHRTWSTPA